MPPSSLDWQARSHTLGSAPGRQVARRPRDQAPLAYHGLSRSSAHPSPALLVCGCGAEQRVPCCHITAQTSISFAAPSLPEGTFALVL